MEVINQTSVSEFNLLGLTDDPELQPLIFSLFLSIYLVTILGNLLIILAVSSESDLHTPMYFLLSNLSFSDICSSTSTIPKMLMNTQKQRQRITYTGCFTQAGFVLVFAFLESFLLAVMAYDRYAAICHPLRYTVIMNPHFCVLLVLVSLLISMADSLLPTLMALHQNLWDCGVAYTDVSEGKILEEEVRRGVEVRVRADGHDGEQVSKDVDQVHRQEQAEDEGLQLCFILKSSSQCSPGIGPLYWTPGGPVTGFMFTLREVGHHLILSRAFLANSLLTKWGCIMAIILFSPRTEIEPSLDSRYKKVFESLLIGYDPAEKQHHPCSNNMEGHNLTHVSEFYLMCFSEDSDLQPILFGLFLTMYLVTVLGNLLIILAVTSDVHLHTPMYFFLSNLSLADICFTSTTVPKLIVDISTNSRVISYEGCLSQVSLFIFFACVDDMLLTVMAYDRFVAICQPLHYAVIMNPHRCVLLVLLSVLVSLLDSQIHYLVALRISCFKDVEIASFFCNPSQLYDLSCSDILIKNIVTYMIGILFGCFPMSGIIFSYCKIVSAILKSPSSEGRYKAFSTCGSHLSVVCLFYGTSLGTYLGSSALHTSKEAMVASLMYTLVTPMLNPFIYSLRNRDIESSLWRLHRRILQSHNVFHPWRCGNEHSMSISCGGTQTL
ncbi:uncharacterized protein LOC104863306 [Fukomys damarensis]|uniref:uncharacterized protein LOC104863306 n=1 Tax=Fukomys damarensis TaxID=885580 RepID=UPI0014559671|nr:uncharacterized protein LOC104863306 [Fukomys damarensis]